MRTLNPPTRDLWKAYALAAPVAPLSCAVLIVAAVFTSLNLGIEINPAAAVVMPFAAVVFGVPAAYVVAGTLGMLIAFCLRNRRCLNGWSILAAAFLWSVLFAIISPAFVGGDGVPASHYAPWVSYVLALTGLPTLLSALVFWRLLERANHRLQLTGDARDG